MFFTAVETEETLLQMDESRFCKEVFSLMHAGVLSRTDMLRFLKSTWILSFIIFRILERNQGRKDSGLMIFFYFSVNVCYKVK